MLNWKSILQTIIVSLVFAGGLAFPCYGGLASKYPGDKGIENDPDVLFAENFEKGTIEKLCKRWDSFKSKDGKVMAYSEDVPASDAGKDKFVAVEE